MSAGFAGKQVNWEKLLNEFNPEKDIMIDVRPKEQHDLINFTEKNEQCHSLPYPEMVKMGKEEFEQKYNLTGKGDDSKSKGIF